MEREWKVNGFVVGCGSAGTFTGVSRSLRERLPDLQCFAVESEGSVRRVRHYPENWFDLSDEQLARLVDAT